MCSVDCTKFPTTDGAACNKLARGFPAKFGSATDDISCDN